MTAMLVELGYDPKGGPRGNIASFKEQITRFARCHFTLVGPGPLEGMRRYIETTPIKQFDVWFAPHPKQGTLWPSEIVLTDDYYYSLKDHAVPFDFRALKSIQNNPRSQDLYLWMTQRLCRISQNKPLLMLWKDLHEMFGGRTAFRRFKQLFPEELTAARIAYPDARVELQKDGALFSTSLPPIPKTKVGVRKKIM